MGYSVNDKVKRLVSNEETNAILVKYAPKVMAAPTVVQAYGMTFRALAEFPSVNLPQDVISKINEELADIEDDEED